MFRKAEDAGVLGGHVEDDNAVARKIGRSDVFVLGFGHYKRAGAARMAAKAVPRHVTRWYEIVGFTQRPWFGPFRLLIM